LQNFNDLGLAAPLTRALAAEGYDHPTPIQEQAIPPVLANRDLLGIAATGTGKTAAFALPILQLLAAAGGKVAPRRCRALVLSPTRELAAQIAERFTAYGRHGNLRVASVVGGVPDRPQARALARGVDVLVATPGRLQDHLDRGNLSLADVAILVLDEADHMLDLGFLPAVRRLVRQLPPKRQNLFFSATMPPQIAGLAAELLHNPARVQVAPPATPAERIAQQVIHVERSDKRAALVRLLNGDDNGRCLVFTRTKRGADRLVRSLTTARIDAVAIHGNKSQGQRERALAGFRDGRTGVLVATDIAARGLDIDGIDLVVNFDLPNVPATYIHRIGRTARAGAAGRAVTLCEADQRPLLNDIERLLGRPIAARGADGGEIPQAPAAKVTAVRSNDQPASPGKRKRRRRRSAPGSANAAKPETASPSTASPSRVSRPPRASRGSIAALPFMQRPKRRAQA